MSIEGRAGAGVCLPVCRGAAQAWRRLGCGCAKPADFPRARGEVTYRTEPDELEVIGLEEGLEVL